MTARFDALCIGNAIVDIISTAEDDFLLQQSLVKGSMRLIDEAEAERLYGILGATQEISGGSAGNTAAGIASFGAKAAYFGKVRNDHLGGRFGHDIRATGVHFATSPASDGPTTARCMILVTPDAERTMNTYLGACLGLGPKDMDPEVIKASSVTYMEGYLWDPPAAKAAFREAAKIAHGAGRKVALTLSDSFCVDRWRAEFLDLMRSGTVDIVFANTSEVKSLYETSDFASALDQLRKDVALGVVTRSELGAVVVNGASTIEAPAFPVPQLVDTTGAGDLFAAGFLAGFARGHAHDVSLRLGALAAAEVISHVGARPLVSLGQLAAQNGLTV